MAKLINRFTEYIKERITIDADLGEIVMLSTLTDEYNTLLLFNTIKKIPIGYISFGLDEINNVYTIGGAYAKRGYGPFLYESVMTYVYPMGASLSRDGATSGDALMVWEKFDKRIDVRKERINSSEMTHKRQDLPNGGMYDDNPKELEYILNLEDTRFFYTYDKSKLKLLLEIGNKYKVDNNISDEEIEYLCWDLE